jgi:hypothetical protein
MEHLLKKNNELEQRLTENQSEIQQFIKQQLAENKKQTEKDSQEATKSLNYINTKMEDRAKIGSTSYFLGWIQS